MTNAVPALEVRIFYNFDSLYVILADLFCCNGRRIAELYQTIFLGENVKIFVIEFN